MASAEQRHSAVPEDKRRRPTVGTDARALLDWQQYALSHGEAVNSSYLGCLSGRKRKLFSNPNCIRFLYLQTRRSRSRASCHPRFLILGLRSRWACRSVSQSLGWCCELLLQYYFAIQHTIYRYSRVQSSISCACGEACRGG